MIFSDSRYATGTILKAFDARKSNYQITVFRNFPEESSAFYYYTWVEGDRMDILAHKFYGNPAMWWKIMDYNPEINDTFDIPVGTTIRIPNGI